MAKEIEKYNSPKSSRKLPIKHKYQFTQKNKIKPLLCMAKPFSPEKSKLFNYQSSMKKKRELLDKLKDIERKVKVLKQLKLMLFF